MKEETDWFKLLLGMAIAIAIIPWTAYVGTVAWGWFVVPLGVSPIGKAHVVGLTMMVGLMKSYNLNEETPPIAVSICVGILVPAMVLLGCYVAHSLMTT